MEKTIKIEDIIDFIGRALSNNLNIRCSKIDNKDISSIQWKIFEKSYAFTVFNSEKEINIDIIDENIKITSFINNMESGTISFKHDFTDKEWVFIEIEYLKVKEYNELKALNSFKSFFNEEHKLTDINDLDNEDD